MSDGRKGGLLVNSKCVYCKRMVIISDNVVEGVKKVPVCSRKSCVSRRDA